ncbi:MAG: SprT family zinc-dependent metalloprotease [Gammaproteobacteria bacterium]|nr:SprT family zinc-dependent metalloprotease [Gammaproteobacteria bacterium]
MATRTIERPCTLDLGTRRVDFTFIRVVGRRHLHLVIGDDGRLQVRVPWRCSEREAREVVRENLAWALEAIDKARASRARRVSLVSGAELPLLDERLRLELSRAAQLDLLDGSGAPAPRARGPDAMRTGGGWVRRRGAVLEVVATSLAHEAPRDLVVAWYRREARRRLPERLAGYARRLDVRPRHVSIRAQRTRWGSCSSHGTICLNWRLLLLPSELSDYILVHELCHLRHLDHSKRFWSLVASVMPDYQRRERRLELMQESLAL